MSTIFLLVSCFALLKLLIEEAQRPSMSLRLAHAAIFALFIVLIQPVCLSISKVAVDTFLNSASRLNDLALLALLDFSMTAGLLTATDVRWPNARRLRYFGFLAMVRDGLHKTIPLFPPVLAFFALFYFRVLLLFKLPGFSFWGVTLVLTAVVFALILFAPAICRSLYVQGKEALTFSLFIFAVVVVANVYSPQSRLIAAWDNSIGEELTHAGLLVGALALLASVGYLVDSRRAKGKRAGGAKAPLPLKNRSSI